MVIDTQGPGRILTQYLNYLPDVKIVGWEPKSVAGTPCHPHGLMCGWFATAPALAAALNKTDMDIELHFVRIFDQHAGAIPDSDAWMLDMIAGIEPDVVSRSWGMWDADSGGVAMQGRIMWGPWTETYLALQAKLGFVDFGAAGNSDTNDADADIDYPQQLMPEVCNVIGSCNRAGVPSVFSGDGQGLQCLFWGEEINCNNNGRWELASGTSFATPKAAGVCAALNMSTNEWRAFVQATATKPYNVKAPHPKYGYGCMEDVFQDLIRRLPSSLLPPSQGTVSASLRPRVLWSGYRRNV